MEISLNSPIGRVCIVHDNSNIIAVNFANIDSSYKTEPATQFETEIISQLLRYFSGEVMQFTLPLRYKGTPFQEKVWQELQRIPYGKSISYKELAHRVGIPNAYRAVGNANNRNPLPILIPCHRVIGANGNMKGYGGGIEKQQWLLAHEISNLLY